MISSRIIVLIVTKMCEGSPVNIPDICCSAGVLHEAGSTYSLPLLAVFSSYSSSTIITLFFSNLSSSQLIVNPFLSPAGKILFRRSHVRDVAMKRLRFIDDYCRVKRPRCKPPSVPRLTPPPPTPSVEGSKAASHTLNTAHMRPRPQ